MPEQPQRPTYPTVILQLLAQYPGMVVTMDKGTIIGRMMRVGKGATM